MMKSILFCLFTVISFALQAQVSVNISGAGPHPSAMLDVQSGNKGFLPPRMNYESILAISNPSPGLQVYDTAYNCMRYYNGNFWVKLSGEVKQPFEPQGESVVYNGSNGQNVIVRDICADSSGNIYTSGRFNGTTTFGNVTLVSAGYEDAFIAKYDKNGKLVWAKRLGSSGDEEITTIAFANGSLYAAGFFTGTLTVGGSTLQNTGLAALMVLKYDTDGNAVWGKDINGPGTNRMDGITADPQGNVYVAGKFYGTAITFSSGWVLTTSGAYDAFITKYNSDGVVQWAKQIGGTDDEKINDIIFYNGLVIATGSFVSPALTLNSFTLSNPGNGSELLVVKLDANGHTQAAQRFGVAGTSETGKAICSDASGNLYIAGEYIYGNTQIGSTTLVNKGGNDCMLVELFVSGNATAYPLHSAAEENTTGIVFINSFLYMSCNASQTGDFTIANKTYTAVNRLGTEVFIARLFAPNPGISQFQWLQQQGGQSNDFVNAITAGYQQKDIYTTGRSELGPAIFGSSVKTTPGYYIWRYTPEQ